MVKCQCGCVDKLKMGTPSVVAGNAKNAIIALLPTNEWKSDPSGCQRSTFVIKIFNGIIRSAQNGLFSNTNWSFQTWSSKRFAAKVIMKSTVNILVPWSSDELADLDEITYVLFCWVYRSFKDVGELETLLNQLRREPRRKWVDEAQYAFAFKNNSPPAGCIGAVLPGLF